MHFSPERSFAPRPCGRAFTLIELMVTLVIISILSSLMLAGLAVARTSAKAAKTSSTIRKISELILPYYERYETRRPHRLSTADLSRVQASDLRRTALRRLMTMELPERSVDVIDIFSPASAPAGNIAVFPTKVLSDVSPVARRYLSLMTEAMQKAGYVDADYKIKAGVKDPVSSADLLHMIVMRGPVADTDIILHFRTDEVQDTDGDGLPEFIDGWGRPIYFRRWATGFNSPVQPIDGLRNSLDESLSLNGHRLVPLIFSPGVDGEIDIESGTLPDNEARYATCLYDPFAFLSTAVPYNNGLSHLLVDGVTPISGAVVSYPLDLPAGEPRRAVAARWPLRPPGTNPNNWFIAIGSESDTNTNEVLESYDNIHNHDLTR
jgi:prepilin-type N-terminal cleavage/methylation domain-containing protein